VQSGNPTYPFRQDAIRVEQSIDGKKWQPVSPNPFLLKDSTSSINIPHTNPTRMWRIIASADNSKTPDHAWTPIEIMFFVDRLAESPLMPADLSGGHPISSGDVSADPQTAFDGNPDTFWISPERGADVRNNAWIGYSFAKPQSIRQITIVQSGGPTYPFRQDAIRVEQSADGKNWKSVSPNPFDLKVSTTSIRIPPTAPTRMWRLVASADNSKTADHAWRPIEIMFFVDQR
jgi:hypothetical protein